MAHPARLSLRAPPHLPFVQGYPGIPPSDPSSPGPPRLQPAVHGTVELRVGNTPVKAKWVRVEIRKHEILPPGFPSSSTTPATIWDHVGEIVTLWQPPAGKDYDTLETADFKFLLPLPANLPPSVEMLKETGVRYELVAALCYRQKGGLFKKEATPIMKVSEPLRIVKHDLHSAWPIYNQPDTKSQQALGGMLTLTVQRPSTAFGPTDRILFTASLKSMQAKPFKLKGFECSIHEVITVFPTQTNTSTNKRKSKLPPQPTVRSRVIASTRAAVDESVGRGGEKSVRVDMGVPSDKLLMTVKQAKMMAVGYELEVKTVSEGAPEVACSGIQYTVGPYARTHAQQAVKDIGFYAPLCPGQPTPALTPESLSRPTSASSSPSVSQPNGHSPVPSPFPNFPNVQPVRQPIQGFVAQDSRRKSSSTTITSTTTTTHDFSPGGMQNGRPYSTMPSQRLAFPNATPSGLTRGPSITYSLADSSQEEPQRYTQSDLGHGGDKRYSSGTNATFGVWDNSLQGALNDGRMGSVPEGAQATTPTRPVSTGPPPARTPPTAWPSAEQEKMRLYNAARNRAAATQSASGASLDQIGMSSGLAAGPVPDSAPPEYEPSIRSTNGPHAQTTLAPPTPTGGRTPTQSGASTPVRSVTPAGSASGPMASGSSSKPPVAYLSAAEEKEQQRKRYEHAQRRVASGPQSSLGHDSSPSTPPSSAAHGRHTLTPPTSASSGGRLVLVGDPVPNDSEYGSSSSPGQSKPIKPPAVPLSSLPSTLSEKEQMKRYYEARDRVDRATQQQLSPTLSDAEPSSSTALAPPIAGPSQAKPSTGMPGSTAPGAMSEKEQMRRYYEAQDRVNRASRTPATSSLGHGNPSPSPPASPSPGPSTSVPPPPPQAGPSGLTEKEQMKRYYEAMDRVRTATGGAGASSSGSAAPPIASGSGSGPSAGSGAGPSSAPPNGSPAWLSAEDEKEQMRKRYESATQAVSRRTQGQRASQSSPPPPAASTSAHGSPIRSQVGGSPTAAYSYVSKPPMPEDDGPPPPLPARPPQEYVRLLSPVQQSGPSFAGLRIE